MVDDEKKELVEVKKGSLFTFGSTGRPFWDVFWGVLDIVTIGLLLFAFLWGNFFAERVDVSVTISSEGYILNQSSSNGKVYNISELSDFINKKTDIKVNVYE